MREIQQNRSFRTPRGLYTFQKDHDAYSTVVHQRKSVYLFPSGSVAKLVIEEMTRLGNCWTYTTKQDSLMMNALLILPIILLQKASFNSKSKENAETSKRILSRWKDGQIGELLFKGKTISREDFIKTTIKYLMKIRKHTEQGKGKMSKAIKILETSSKEVIMLLKNETFEVPRKKHPRASKEPS